MEKNFKKLTSTFKNSIKSWDYFVDWVKVNRNTADLEIVLNKLNYLLGKKDLENEFYKLYKTNPDIIVAIPALLAIRKSEVEIYEPVSKTSEFFRFDLSGTDNPKKVFKFLKQTNLLNLFDEGGIKNLVDYVKGVEVGLDSNGRKNRGGKLMEKIVDLYIKSFCEENNFKYLVQPNAKKIFAEWNYKVGVDKSSRSFDFAVYNPKTKCLKLFETNFYNDKGSKLKAVCGEFKGLNNELKTQGIDFVWLTDGLGWMSALRPLEEAYNNNDYIFNLSMLEDNILSSLKW